MRHLHRKPERLEGAPDHVGAFDGPSALARAHAFHPAAVLLDIGLPIADGAARPHISARSQVPQCADWHT